MGRVCGVVWLAILGLFGLPEPVMGQPSDATVAAIRGAGGQVLPIAQNDPRLDVGFHLSSQPLTDEALTTLAGASDRVAHLNLSGTEFSDSQAKHLSDLKELTRLHLEKTGVTDATLPALRSLSKLEYLNLYGTKVSDAGVAQIAEIASLRRVYLWNSAVTSAGVAQLRALRPDLTVIAGIELAQPQFSPLEAPRPAKKS